MKNGKLIIAIVALFCVSQARAMLLDPKKRIGDYSRAEIMTLITNTPSLKQQYDDFVQMGREHAMQILPGRMNEFEQGIAEGRVLATDYTRKIRDQLADKTLRTLQSNVLINVYE